MLARASQSGEDVTIDFGRGDVLTLTRVDVAELTASDFVFGPETLDVRSEAVDPALFASVVTSGDYWLH